MRIVRLLVMLGLLHIADLPQTLAVPREASDIFARENLLAWCIVPFDAAQRTPSERAAMLGSLGLGKFAYDWRAEHLRSFDAELAALRREGIELTACWFPPTLNDDARTILAALQKREVQTQLWVALGDPGEAEQSAKVKAAVAQLRPLIDAAAAQGCTVGLYNHGGWFGGPENQVAIIEQLKSSHVGIVFNLHHAHDQLDRLPTVLKMLRPHLYAVNLNGMDPAGEKHGRKILPLGQGEFDLEVLRTIQRSGYRGPIGVIGHTQDDAEARLRDNLDGLDWLVDQLAGETGRPRPEPRTPIPAHPD